MCKDFKPKILGQYHDLHVQSDTILLPDVFEICVMNYMSLILLSFFIAPGLAWQAALKKIKVRSNLLTDINVINGRKRYQKRNVTLFIDMQKLKANK